ncbi:hypothetical protein [Pseudoalteromonas sp. B530]|uniref:hypothetical protein n=1 Tax=unclassified Pseudoalteromonas TaxID=194690 RepID=UPI00224AEF1D|nr:hypothetical protein [Pseudoalteromonas sp. B530]MCX2769325.1 hypothetical protein [Pseudoalteromonas sp. B530]
MNSTQLALKLAARKALIIRSSGYLVILNKKSLTQLASDLLLQIEQVLRQTGVIVRFCKGAWICLFPSAIIFT